MKKLSLFLSLFLLLGCGAWADAWHVLGKISVPGNGGWDYLTYDPPSHRLFISRSTHVQVLDTVTGEVVGDIPDTEGVHGIVLVPETGHGFTSNGKSGTVTIFDLVTYKPVARVPVGKDPDAIIYDAMSGRVLTMDGDGQDITAIDARTGQVVGNVPLGAGPEFAAVDGRGHLWVNLEDKSQVAEVDTRTLTVLGHWSIAPGANPTGLSIDPHRHRLFIGCHNKLMVVFDTLTHKVDTTLPIGERVDATAFDPELGTAFSSNGDGTLTVVGTHPYRVLQTVATQVGARTMALDPVEHKIYLCSATVAGPVVPGKRPDYQPDTFVVLIVGR